MGRVQYGPKWRPTHFAGRATTGIEFSTGYSFGFDRGPIIYIIGRTVSNFFLILRTRYVFLEHSEAIDYNCHIKTLKEIKTLKITTRIA